MIKYRGTAAGKMVLGDSFIISLHSLSLFILSSSPCCFREMSLLPGEFRLNNIASRDGMGEEDDLEMMLKTINNSSNNIDMI